MSSDGTRGELQDARATLDLWRECGADRYDPVRFRFLDALERRAAAYGGQVRQQLDDRLAALLRAYDADLDAATVLPGAAPLPAHPERGPLAGLIDDMAAGVASADGDSAAIHDEAAALRAGYPEVQMLDYFRAVWSRVSADRQVRQSQQQVHKNAGPLNSNQLVHRALSLMRELSPGYLQQFLSYTDALMWMEQMSAAAAPAAKDAQRTSAAKKAARGKTR